MASAEARPLAQTGGLADVLRALPDALVRAGHPVRRFLPAYGFLDRSGFSYEPVSLAVPLGPGRAAVRFLVRSEPGGVRTTLVECDELFGREGIYGPPGGEYPDNARRFALFSRALCEWAGRAPRPPRILHVHDWHAALVPFFVRHAYSWRQVPRTVLTIHNLGYQGQFGAAEIDWLALPDALRDELFRPEGIEFYGGVNFLKAGILTADALTTVSPGYAREMLTPEFGCGLDGLLRWQAGKLTGILNGADYDLWDPRTDPHLPRRYSAASLADKETSRQALRQRFQLPPAPRALLGVVSRLVQQKGIDVLAQAAPALLDAGADLVVLGAGEPGIVEELERLRRARPDRVGISIGYNEALSHLVVAGSDLLLVPSRYEPCGLVQMYALRYGTIPVVSRTGGLADTVRDESESPGKGTGFVLSPLAPETLADAVRRALALRASDPAAWLSLQRRGMAEDFSWDQAAARYAQLYRSLLA